VDDIIADLDRALAIATSSVPVGAGA